VKQVERRILALIPARGGSQGIPRKNLVPVAGKPLLAYTVERGGPASG
jgi:CMP-N-acetylneuraminic acid synthetase